MKIKLNQLQPNPYRDFNIDPIDQDNVTVLAESIREDGFWGGVVIRENNGAYQIAAGHHRIEAAKAAGITDADFTVKAIDDAAMIRIYARENATQRGNNSTSVAGSVASAIRYLAMDKFCGREITSAKAREQGIGEPAILEFLNGVPGINRNVIKEQLANLKSSGAYARIIKEVGNEVEAKIIEQEKIADEEAKAKLNAMRERSAKASAKASESPVTFDFEGVAKVFKNSNQVKVFREICTDQGVTPYLQIDQQARLAKAIADEAKAKNQELSGRFIRDEAMNLVINVKHKERQLSMQEQAALARKSRENKLLELQNEFSKHIKAAISCGYQIGQVEKDWPVDEAFIITSELRNRIDDIKKLADELSRL
jgi:ParB-like chromosome segregation protein Spo0J